MMVCLALVSWGTYAQHDHDIHSTHQENDHKTIPEFKDKNLGAAYGHYIHLKEALVASNYEKANEAAIELEKALDLVNNGDIAYNDAKNIASAGALEEQRKHFTALSNELAKLITGGPLSMGEVYLEYCPMANGNSGGFWLSNEKEIQNPYFGASMLTCGEVTKAIN